MFSAGLVLAHFSGFVVFVTLHLELAVSSRYNQSSHWPADAFLGKVKHSAFPICWHFTRLSSAPKKFGRYTHSA
jgi:hypothetical protein